MQDREIDDNGDKLLAEKKNTRWKTKKMADRTQHEGKTECAKESHDWCSQPLTMHMLQTADLGTQALLVVNSFKLHLTALKRSLYTTVELKAPLSNKVIISFYVLF